MCANEKSTMMTRRKRAHLRGTTRTVIAVLGLLLLPPVLLLVRLDLGANGSGSTLVAAAAGAEWRNDGDAAWSGSSRMDPRFRRYEEEGLAGDGDGAATTTAEEGALYACDCYAPPRPSSPDGNDDDDGGGRGGKGRLAYLISAHNARTLDDAAYLFRAIRYPSTVVIVHVDTKVDPSIYAESALRREIEHCPCGSDVRVESLFSPKWGEWSMNDPTHWAMDLLSTHPRFRDKWDVFLNLSGDTMPVLTPDVMAQLFDPDGGPLAGRNFVTSSACETGFVPTSVWQFPKRWHKRTHYTFAPDGEYCGDPVVEYVDDDGATRTVTMATHFGSQWMALTPDFVRYLATSLKREDSLPSRFKQTLIDMERLMADETYVSTILMNVYPYNETLPEILPGGNLASLPYMYAMRYERMDEHYPTAFGLVPVQQRYDVPESSLCDKPRVWGPYFLGVYDLSNIRRSGALFVRKVSVHLDRNIVRMLPVSSHDMIPDIQWPDEVKITDKVDWGEVKKRARAKAKAAAEKAKEAEPEDDEEEGEEENGKREETEVQSEPEPRSIQADGTNEHGQAFDAQGEDKDRNVEVKNDEANTKKTHRRGAKKKPKENMRLEAVK